MKSKYELQAFDLEVIGNVVRAATNSPDLIDDETFISIIELLEMVSSSSIYAHKPLDINST